MRGQVGGWTVGICVHGNVIACAMKGESEPDNQGAVNFTMIGQNVGSHGKKSLHH